MHSSFIMYILSFPYAFLPRNHGHFMNWKERKSFEERAAPWAGLRTWSAIAVVQKHSFKKEARWTQLVNAFWKKSACAWLFDTLFRTLGRLEPKWIVGNLGPKKIGTSQNFRKFRTQKKSLRFSLIFMSRGFPCSGPFRATSWRAVWLLLVFGPKFQEILDGNLARSAPKHLLQG